ncbi:MAG: 16S rRNA (guanine(527)-N(7))-methyltransferase RsmG [Bacteroidales bacterium]|nr:16S rRNA (guanine(527)-N(7))-methyltransferase RsmG [Bacteroidales bacterium]
MDIILKYFPTLSESQRSQLSALYPLYSEWNAKINVISRKDIENLYQNHVLHSLSIAKLIQFQAGSRVMDVGTGGGFPGIPLAIIFPDTQFLLVDSIGKKIKVVDTITGALGLKNVRTLHGRVESVSEKFDFIVSRAVTDLPTFYQWVHKKIGKPVRNSLENGILYLKGGDLEKELKALPVKRYYEYPISLWFNESYFQEKSIVHVPL